MNDKELWELMSIICEGQDSEQRRKVEQYITNLQEENEKIERLNNKVEELMELYTTEREVKEDYKAIISKVISHIDIKISRALNEEDYNIDTDDLVDLRSELKGSDNNE